MVDALIAAEVASASRAEADAYLAGAAHDATYSGLHRTTRFCQADRRWLEVLSDVLRAQNIRSWIYKEGLHRSVWVLETTWRATQQMPRLAAAKRAYLRGYFDAEGGIPRLPGARFYIQLVQKDLEDISAARVMLLELGISCGTLHNPSVRRDPDYWRFYVASASHADFCAAVGSWHPRKRARLEVERARRVRMVGQAGRRGN